MPIDLKGIDKLSRNQHQAYSKMHETKVSKIVSDFLLLFILAESVGKAREIDWKPYKEIH